MSIHPESKSQAAQRSELTVIDPLRSPLPRRNAIRQGAAVTYTNVASLSEHAGEASTVDGRFKSQVAERIRRLRAYR